MKNLRIIVALVACCLMPLFAGCEKKHEHSLELISAVASTCENEGSCAYYKCSGCLKLFDNEFAEKEITLESTVVDALGHEYTEDSGGILCKKICNRCSNEKFEHKLKFVNKIDSSCESEGVESHYVCEICDKLFNNDVAESELSKESLVIEEKGHDYVKDENGEECNRICSRCDDVIVAHDYVTILEENIGFLYDRQCSHCGDKIVIETLPIISITTHNGQEIDGSRLGENLYYECSINVECENEDYELNDVEAKVKVRGNYTADYLKKPFRIKFDKKQDLLGVCKGENKKNWVLLADWKDPSKLRNATAFFLGNSILNEDGLYCTNYRFVEVYLNQSYRGVYLLCDQQEVDEDRINVSQPSDGYKGVEMGYVVELDEYADLEDDGYWFRIDYLIDSLKWIDGSSCSSSKFQTKYSIKNDLYEDESDNPNKLEEKDIIDSQNLFIKKWIQNIFQVVYDAIYNEHEDITISPYKTINTSGEIVNDFNIKSKQEAVEKLIDVKSLVDIFILNEICMDPDVGWSSFRMSIDLGEGGNKKLTFQAPWDWDYSLGLYKPMEDDKLHNCMPANVGTNANYVNPWLLVLCQQDWFWEKVNEKWQLLSDGGVFDEALNRIVDAWDIYNNYWSKDSQIKWTEMSLNGTNMDFAPASLDEANYLCDWLRSRIEWLNNEIKDVVLKYNL